MTVSQKRPATGDNGESYSSRSQQIAAYATVDGVLLVTPEDLR